MSAKNKLVIILLQPIFLILYYLFFPPLMIQKYPGPISQANQLVLPLLFGKTYKATIFHTHDYLKSITVQLKNPGLISTASINLKFTDNTGKVLDELVTSGLGVGDPHQLLFTFAKPIPSSQKPFNLLLTTNNTNPQQLYVYAASETQINYQTQLVYSNFRDRFKQNISFQYSKLQQLEHKLFLPWFTLILFCNFLLLKIIPTISKH